MIIGVKLYICPFKDICRYMKGELKGDTEPQVLQGIINQGLQRMDLRDEIFCQLMRQTSDNPHEDLCLRVWQIMCLCVVSFHPSRSLKKVTAAVHMVSNLCVCVHACIYVCRYVKLCSFYAFHTFCVGTKSISSEAT